MFTAVSALEYVNTGNTSGKCIYWRWQLLISPTASAVICVHLKGIFEVQIVFFFFLFILLNLPTAILIMEKSCKDYWLSLLVLKDSQGMLHVRSHQNKGTVHAV